MYSVGTIVGRKGSDAVVGMESVVTHSCTEAGRAWRGRAAFLSVPGTGTAGLSSAKPGAKPCRGSWLQMLCGGWFLKGN